MIDDARSKVEDFDADLGGTNILGPI